MMKYIIISGMWLAVMMVFEGCTLKIDNPFYAPSTLDVNKASSTGANNYLGVKKNEKEHY